MFKKRTKTRVSKQITLEQVEFIKFRLKSGEDIPSLAKEYDLTVTRIAAIGKHVLKTHIKSGLKLRKCSLR
jgi:hypothetical protein